MKIITSDYNTLKIYCNELINMAVTSGFSPDVIVGIPSGGTEIGRIMRDLAPEGCRYNECVIIRPSSKKKKSRLKRILPYLPTFILNFLRICEAKISFRFSSRGKINKVEIPDEIALYNRILIVDDAVDSGATLNTVYNAIHKIAPYAQIKTAAITVTLSNPIRDTDFSIFHNNTLVRFPWSMDAK